MRKVIKAHEVKQGDKLAVTLNGSDTACAVAMYGEYAKTVHINGVEIDRNAQLEIIVEN